MSAERTVVRRTGIAAARAPAAWVRATVVALRILAERVAAERIHAQRVAAERVHAQRVWHRPLGSSIADRDSWPLAVAANRQLHAVGGRGQRHLLRGHDRRPVRWHPLAVAGVGAA